MSMSPPRPGTAALNRVMLALVGAALVALAVAAWLWRYDVFSAGSTLDTASTVDVMEREWFAWTAGGAGVVLALLALVWLLANLRRPSAPVVRLAGTGATGRLEVDLTSVAGALTPRFERAAPVRSAKAVTRRQRRDHLIEVRGEIDPRADATTLHAAASGLAGELAHAFPSREVKGRILLGTARARLFRGRTARVR